eukprot:9099706-Lingulodinium_polyedra.AAC.1
MEQQGSWVSVVSHVHKVCNSGARGLRLFGFALKFIVSEGVQKAHADEIAKVVALPKIDQSMIIKMKCGCYQQLEQ